MLSKTCVSCVQKKRTPRGIRNYSHKRLKPHSPLPPPLLPLLKQLRLPPQHLLPPPHQHAPIARLGGGCEVPLPEHRDGIVRDALRLLRVREQVPHLGVEVGEVAGDEDVVLPGAGVDEEVVVVLDPLELVREDDGAAELAVFEGAGVGAAWWVLVLLSLTLYSTLLLHKTGLGMILTHPPHAQ